MIVGEKYLRAVILYGAHAHDKHLAQLTLDELRALKAECEAIRQSHLRQTGRARQDIDNG